jgi:hypothetical protein
MGESKSRIEPVTCPDCGLRGEVRLAQSGFKNNFPNVVRPVGGSITTPKRTFRIVRKFRARNRFHSSG